MSKQKPTQSLKITSYYIDSDNGLILSLRGGLWTISVDTPDGVVELEMTAEPACTVRHFFKDAKCTACKRKDKKAKS